MGDETSTEQEGSQLPKKRRKYIGEKGLRQAMVDIEDMRQGVVGHLESHRSTKWKNKVEERYRKPLGEINIAGLSFELINSASSEADVPLIRGVNGLALDVLFEGNLTNFLEEAEHRTWDTIRRETGAFVKGYELARQTPAQ